MRKFDKIALYVFGTALIIGLYFIGFQINDFKERQHIRTTMENFSIIGFKMIQNDLVVVTDFQFLLN